MFYPHRMPTIIPILCRSGISMFYPSVLFYNSINICKRTRLRNKLK